MNNVISHPNHYQSRSGLEAKDVIEAFTEDLTGCEAAYTANILKYAMRWKKKNGVEDLKKLKQYADFLIEHLEAEKEKEKEPYPFISPGNLKKLDGKEIVELLSSLNEIINVFGFATVGDMYDLLGVTRNYNDNNYGWTDLSTAEIVYLGNGQFDLKMPNAMPLNI